MGATFYAVAAADAIALLVHDDPAAKQTFGVAAPDTVQGTAVHEHGGPCAWTVMHGMSLYVENQSLAFAYADGLTRF